MLNRYLKYWAGKTVLITGGSSGIGFAVAEYINGIAKKIILVSENTGKLKDAKSKLLSKENPSNISTVKCNVGELEQVKALSKRVMKNEGCPDILINNAGFAHYYTFDQMTQEDVEETANVNFTGFMRVTRAFIPHMIAGNNNSCIVNVASVAGAFPITPNSVYGGAKAGMLAFSELLEVELRPFNINVLTVCPGRVITPFFDHISYQTRKAGSETSIVTPIEDVVAGLVKSVALGRKTVFTPNYWRYFSWLLGVDRLFLRRIYKMFLSHRVARLRDHQEF